ncbi:MULTISPECIES: histidine phosphatase family protein [unclassified Massilia]|uniref:histidine phosphatase family protein n=1 Tax=unclassified Massilia TaxID=2609279 RepID=UPI00177BFD28|nr:MULTISPECIES: histidine phosphatase family protein [unclassified Massilia]MBD8531761.1 histidine phosphatase family protein [Massilia sp. CFBP 13647]MBD8675206.1 histidine phosphatase family protein [Massilia sp. CFBP 13721]
MKAPAFLLLLLAALPSQAADMSEDALWQKLRGGGVTVLMRHATTVPGIGDPPGFKLDQCPTQRNLSERGRADARAVGAAFQRHQVTPGAVWSSRWCRCLDTARLAFGRVQPEPSLDSMFEDDAGASSAKLRDLRARLAARTETTPLVLVTHDVNIRALTGQSLAQGEMVLLTQRDGKLAVLGRLPVPAAEKAAP